jgi:hypothetical protein
VEDVPQQVGLGPWCCRLRMGGVEDRTHALVGRPGSELGL